MTPPVRKLAIHDLLVLRAWAGALAKAHVLSVTEFEDIQNGLEKIGADVESAEVVFASPSPKGAREWVDSRAQQVLGALFVKLTTHLGHRERDVTVFRLWMLEAAAAARHAMEQFAVSLLKLAHRSRSFVVLPPNFNITEPCLLSFWILSKIDAVARDLDRLRDALDRGDECALGSGEGLGCAFPIDRELLASELGFVRVCDNALDGIHNVEFAWELASASNVAIARVREICSDCVLLAPHRFDGGGAAPPADTPEAAPTFFFEILASLFSAAEAAAGYIDTIEVTEQLITIDEADESVRKAIIAKNGAAGTSPEAVDRRIAVLRGRFMKQYSSDN